jgi:hypothetical protein
MIERRIIGLLGQGRELTSPGFVMFINSLRALGVVSKHSWDAPIVNMLREKSQAELDRTIVVGYSLGANQLGFISKHMGDKKIALGIAYDPSWRSPLVARAPNGAYIQLAPNFKRLMVYRNTGAWFWGGSTYAGPNVEETRVSNFHLGIQFDQSLHDRSRIAIMDI